MSRFAGHEQGLQAVLASRLVYVQEREVKFDRNCFYWKNCICVSYKSTGLYIHDKVYGLDI